MPVTDSRRGELRLSVRGRRASLPGARRARASVCARLSGRPIVDAGAPTAQATRSARMLGVAGQDLLLVVAVLRVTKLDGLAVLLKDREKDAPGRPMDPPGRYPDAPGQSMDPSGRSMDPRGLPMDPRSRSTDSPLR